MNITFGDSVHAGKLVRQELVAQLPIVHKTWINFVHLWCFAELTFFCLGISDQLLLVWIPNKIKERKPNDIYQSYLTTFGLINGFEPKNILKWSGRNLLGATFLRGMDGVTCPGKSCRKTRSATRLCQGDERNGESLIPLAQNNKKAFQKDAHHPLTNLMSFGDRH